MGAEYKALVEYYKNHNAWMTNIKLRKLMEDIEFDISAGSVIIIYLDSMDGKFGLIDKAIVGTKAVIVHYTMEGDKGSIKITNNMVTTLTGAGSHTRGKSCSGGFRLSVLAHKLCVGELRPSGNHNRCTRYSEYIFAGRAYKSLTSLCNEQGLAWSTFKFRARKLGKKPNELTMSEIISLVSMPLHPGIVEHQMIEYKGLIYASIEKLCSENNLNTRQFRRELSAYGNFNNLTEPQKEDLVIKHLID